jgi:hypothetical protein
MTTLTLPSDKHKLYHGILLRFQYEWLEFSGVQSISLHFCGSLFVFEESLYGGPRGRMVTYSTLVICTLDQDSYGESKPLSCCSWSHSRRLSRRGRVLQFLSLVEVSKAREACLLRWWLWLLSLQWWLWLLLRCLEWADGRDCRL